MFPAPISFLKDELKAELGKKTKKDEEEDDTKFCSLKVPMDRADKESNTWSRSRSMTWGHQKYS
jgi:hypothetical protein